MKEYTRQQTYKNGKKIITLDLIKKFYINKYYKKYVIGIQKEDHLEDNKFIDKLMEVQQLIYGFMIDMIMDIYVLFRLFKTIKAEDNKYSDITFLYLGNNHTSNIAEFLIECNFYRSNTSIPTNEKKRCIDFKNIKIDLNSDIEKLNSDIEKFKN